MVLRYRQDTSLWVGRINGWKVITQLTDDFPPLIKLRFDLRTSITIPVRIKAIQLLRRNDRFIGLNNSKLGCSFLASCPVERGMVQMEATQIHIQHL